MEGSGHAKKCSDEFRTRAVASVRSGQTFTKTAEDLGITDACLYSWVKQDRIDRGESEGVSRAESRELRKAKRRIREPAVEIEILRRANALLGSAAQHQLGHQADPHVRDLNGPDGSSLTA